LFLIANKDTCAKVIDVANICINTFKKLKDANAIIALIDVINSLYVDESSNNS